MAQFGRIGGGIGDPRGTPGRRRRAGLGGVRARRVRVRRVRRVAEIGGVLARGRGPDLANAPPSLLSRSMETLENIGDLDYLTLIVFRMAASISPRRTRDDSASRFCCSTGVGLDPFKRNVIQEFEKAAADAHRREKASVSPGAVTGQRRKSEDAASLPSCLQFPVQNDRAKAPRRAADEEAAAAAGGGGGGGGKGEGKDNAAAKREKNAAYLTLDDLRDVPLEVPAKQERGPRRRRGGGTGPPRATGRGSPKKETAAAARRSPSRRRSGRNRAAEVARGGPSEERERQRERVTRRSDDASDVRRDESLLQSADVTMNIIPSRV